MHFNQKPDIAIFFSLYLFPLYSTNTIPAEVYLEQLGNDLTIHFHFTYTYLQKKLEHNGQSFAKISLQIHLVTHRTQEGRIQSNPSEVQF